MPAPRHTEVTRKATHHSNREVEAPPHPCHEAKRQSHVGLLGAFDDACGVWDLPLAVRADRPGGTGNKTKEIKMSSENKSSQESIRANTEKMTKEARLDESRVKIGKNGRVVVEGRNPSIPLKDKKGRS